jgi:hypothetical protein
LTKLQQAFDRKIHQLNQELANRKTLIIEQAARELQQLQQSSNQQPAANFLPQSSTQGDSAEASSSECKLCYANDIQVEFQPCRHQLCSECCLRLQQNSSDKFSCPWDRSLVESVKHLQSILQ